MTRERPDKRVVDHTEQYTGEIFGALADTWNTKIARAKPGENITMITPPPVEYDDPVAHIISNVFDQPHDEPFKLLCPVLIGGNHWVGIVVERGDEGKYKIVANDPLRTGSKELDEILAALSESLDEAECSYDPQALKQEDYVSCGPYTFENMTSYVTGERRPDIKRMALRTEQLETIKDSDYIKQVSFSQEVDAVLKELSVDGRIARANSNAEIFNILKSKLQSNPALRNEYGQIFERFNSTSDHQGQLLNRIRFHAEHDAHGLRKDILLTKVGEIAAFAVDIGSVEAAGVDEFIERLHTNQDVDKLPPAVFELLTNPANYNELLASRVGEIYGDSEEEVVAAPVVVGTPVSPRSHASSRGDSPDGLGGGGPSPVSRMSPEDKVEECMNQLAISLAVRYEDPNAVIQEIVKDLDRGLLIEEIVKKTNVLALTKQVEQFAALYANPESRVLIDSLLVIGEKVRTAEAKAAAPPSTPSVARGRGVLGR